MKLEYICLAAVRSCGHTQKKHRIKHNGDSFTTPTTTLIRIESYGNSIIAIILLLLYFSIVDFGCQDFVCLGHFVFVAQIGQLARATLL